MINIEPRLKKKKKKKIVVDLKAPDFETRIAILQSKLEAKGESIDYDLLEIIAKYITNNVRELEWALNTLLTRKNLMWCNLKEDDVIDCLKTLWYIAAENPIDEGAIAWMNTKSTQNFGKIVEMAAQYYGLSVSDLKSDSRKQEITVARQLLMLIAKKYYGWTLEKVWDYFGWKNHASVIYAINNIEKKLKSNKELAHDYNVFVERVEQ